MRPRDVALALLMVVLWGVNFVVIKAGLRGVSPFVLGGLRFVLTAFPAILFLPRPRVPLRLSLAFAGATFLGQFSLLFWAIKVGMPSGLASLVLQSQVFFTVLLAGAVLRERPGRVQLAGMALAGAGLAWMGAELGTEVPLAGFLLTLCAALAWAIGTLASRSLARHGPVNGLHFVVWAGLIPPVPFFALAWAVEGPGAIASSLRAMDLGSWAAAAYLAFGATLGGYGLWNRLLRSYPAAQVARFTLLVPVVGILSGALAFGERLTAVQLLATGMVMAGLAMPLAAAWLNRRSSRAPAAEGDTARR
ncbi:MAG TPA: EamA family transporter [Anaeromyxobacteraceae bacterium]|nr:EamA family transporter [Anaeromyxobacteraceae bacterium]